MKKLKFMLACSAILMFSNLAFAVNPDNLANKMVTKLSKDIVLTDSQKVVILAKATELTVKRQSANTLTDKTEKSDLKKQVFQEYKAVLDSLLTSEQKQQLSLKQTERRDAIIKKQSKK